MGKKILVVILMALIAKEQFDQYYFSVYSDTITWISGNDFTSLFEQGIKEMGKDTCLTIKNVLLRRRKAAIKRYALYSNFYNNHIISNESISTFRFKDNQEIRDSQLFGVMKEYYQDEDWLIMLGDTGSGRHISTVYVFYRSDIDYLILCGLITGKSIIYLGHNMSYIVSNNELIVSLDGKVIVSRKMDEEVRLGIDFPRHFQ